MASRPDAEKHINSFWERRGIDRNSTGLIDVKNNINLRDLSNSLEIISDTLYGDLTHFFWELLQNAEDSEYSSTPHVEFILSGRNLTYRTNENGFTWDDVESLCAIGHSSKTQQPNKIGEKGIGFKSVFKVADVVTIHSGPYSFKLDTRSLPGNLGMILPHWLDKPENSHGKTTIILQLRASLDLSELHQHVYSFDFTFLLFTQNVKEISLKGLGRDGKPFERRGWLTPSSPAQSWQNQFSTSAESIQTSFNGSPTATMEYITIRWHGNIKATRQPTAMPNEKTTIVLAFPHHGHQPIIENRYTYAYLPIGYFGFQFVIHADFVLHSNREKVDRYRQWNQELCRVLMNVLCWAFQWLAISTEPNMRKGWPEYMVCLWSIHDPSLYEVALCTTSTLRSLPLVRKELPTGLLGVPHECLAASEEFRDGRGNLLITTGTYAQEISSNEYSFNAAVALSRLGVRTFECKHFVESLGKYTPADMTDQPAEWHSRVARILHRYFTVDQYQPDVLTAIRSLLIIPLNNGKWVSGASCTDTKVFLDPGRRLEHPIGVGLLFVEITAAQNLDRRQLYELLGVKTCNEAEVCKMILDSHAKTGASEDRENLVSHAVYVFRAGYKSQDGKALRLRLLDCNRNARYGERVHLPFDANGRYLRRIFNEFVGMNWLHPDYEGAVAQEQRAKWFRFLGSLDGVYSLPPLHLRGALSEEMKHVLARDSSMEFLQLLRLQQFYRYCDSLPPKVIEEISEILVTTDQGMKKLCDTRLPSLEPVEPASQCLLPVLQLPKNFDEDWSFLGKFQVQTELSPMYYVKQLRALQNRKGQRVERAVAQEIYKYLATHRDANSWKLPEIFRNEKLIYVETDPEAKSDDFTWVSLKQCVWRATFPCARLQVLSKIYHGCEQLFQALLNVRDANVDDLVSELEAMPSIAEPKRSRLLRNRMLPALESFIVKASLSPTQRQKLLQLPIFPVTEGGSDGHPSIKTLLRATDKFWIADLKFLKSKFESRLPLLDVSGKLLEKSMKNIFQVFSMDSKRLSRSVRKKEIQADQGVSYEQEDLKLERRLQRQAGYIFGIIYQEKNSNLQADDLKAMLDNLKVFRVSNIIIRRYVMDAGEEKYGVDEKGDVLLEWNENFHVKVRKDLRTMDIVIPLSERLAEHFDLGDCSRGLLVKVLTTERVEQFEEALEKAGIEIDQAHASRMADDSVHESSDEDTITGDPNDGLELAFHKLRLSDRRADGGPDEEFWNSQHHKPAKTQISRRIYMEDDTVPSSSISCGSWSGYTLSSGQRSDVIIADSGIATHDNILSLTARLNNAQLSDSTQNVLRTLRVPPRVALGPALREYTEHISVAAATLELTSHSPSPQTSERNPDAKVDSSVAPNTSTGSYGNAENWSEAQADTDAVLSSPKHIYDPWETPTKEIRQSDHLWSSEIPDRSDHVRSRFDIPGLPQDEPHEIGFVGEHLVYKFLETKLAPFFTPTDWTSHYQRNVFGKKFPLPGDFREKENTDFTYHDTRGHLGRYLRDQNPNYEGPTGEQNNIIYHLEVKATMDGLDTLVRFSNNQIDLAKKWSARFPTSTTENGVHVHILVRVYDLRSDPLNPKICLFPDPWNLICQNSLSIRGRDGIYLQPNVSRATESRRLDSVEVT